MEASAKGVSHFLSHYFVIVLISLFYVGLVLPFVCSKTEKHKKIENFSKFSFSVSVILLLVVVMGLLPEFAIKDIKVGSDSIIGKYNTEEFLNHINSIYDLNEKSLVELTHDYEAAVVSLVEKLEARFINLHPTI